MKFLKEIKLIKKESDAKSRSSMNILPLGNGLCKLIFVDDCGNELTSSQPKGGGAWYFAPIKPQGLTIIDLTSSTAKI